MEWIYKSRGETPEEDIGLDGICELNLSYNRLDSVFIKELVYFLNNDRWIKSINLKLVFGEIEVGVDVRIEGFEPLVSARCGY